MDWPQGCLSLCVLVRVSMAAINHHNQQLGEERVNLAYTSQVTLLHWEKSRKELRAGMEAETMEKHCLLASLSWLIRFVFLC